MSTSSVSGLSTGTSSTGTLAAADHRARVEHRHDVDHQCADGVGQAAAHCAAEPAVSASGTQHPADLTAVGAAEPGAQRPGARLTRAVCQLAERDEQQQLPGERVDLVGRRRRRLSGRGLAARQLRSADVFVHQPDVGPDVHRRRRVVDHDQGRLHHSGSRQHDQRRSQPDGLRGGDRLGHDRVLRSRHGGAHDTGELHHPRRLARPRSPSRRVWHAPARMRSTASTAVRR